VYLFNHLNVITETKVNAVQGLMICSFTHNTVQKVWRRIAKCCTTQPLNNNSKHFYSLCTVQFCMATSVANSL